MLKYVTACGCEYHGGYRKVCNGKQYSGESDKSLRLPWKIALRDFHDNASAVAITVDLTRYPEDYHGSADISDEHDEAEAA